MKIVQVTMAPLKRDSGLSGYVRDISRHIADSGHTVTILGQAGSSSTSATRPEPHEEAQGLIWRVNPQTKGIATRVSAETRQAIDDVMADADLVHLHGMRTRLNAVVFQEAQRTGTPIVVSPHGQVHPWLLSQRKLRKWMVDRIWDRNMYRKADYGLAMSPAELDHLAAFMPKLPSRWLPIGIDPPEAPDEAVRRDLLAQAPALQQQRRRLLYLAPLNIRKGYDLLVEAFCQMDRRGIQVVFAGPDSDSSHQEIQRQFDRAVVEQDAVVHLPRMTAAQRDVLLNLADVFVVPSRSENFGIVVTEALAAGVPVLTTTATPWPGLDPDQTVTCVEPEAISIATGLTALFSESDADRRVRIESGLQLVSEKFMWPKLIEKLLDFYGELVTHKPRRRKNKVDSQLLV